MNQKGKLNQNSKSLVRRARGDQRGQMLAAVAVMLLFLLGISGFALDTGRVYFSYRELVTSTNAAVLAAAEGMPNFSTAATNATTYSGVSGNQNAFSNLQNVTMVSGYPKFECLTTLANAGMNCVPDSSGTYSGTANAIQVAQKVSVPLTFARMLGVGPVSLTAVSTASMRGAATAPYNVAIIVDTTDSMSDKDSNCSNKTRLACALSGVQTLLQDLSPCVATQSSCGSATNGSVTNSVDRVSLFTFPNMTTTTTSDDYNCPPPNPTIEPYTFPAAGASTMSTMPFYITTGSGNNKKTTTDNMTYQVTYGLGDADDNGFLSDYRTSDTATSLSTKSDLVLSVGGKSGCAGMGDPGGEGTYYAGAIYAAQSALTAEAVAFPGSQNVLILVSDGDASASQSQMATGSQSTTVATSSGTYPSYDNECGQAITAAAYAAGQKTRVYAIAYGAPSTGCSTDKSGTYKGISPCTAMKDIASLPQYFYSDYNQSGSGVDKGCVAPNNSVSDLNDIFTEIAGDLTVARLIPNNMT